MTGPAGPVIGPVVSPVRTISQEGLTDEPSTGTTEATEPPTAYQFKKTIPQTIRRRLPSAYEIPAAPETRRIPIVVR